MNKHILTIALILLLTQSNYAVGVNGRIKLSDGSVLNDIHLLIPQKMISGKINFMKIQKRIRYKTATGEKKALKSHEIQELYFTYLGKEYTFEYVVLTTPPPLKTNKKVLLNKVIDGKISYYRYYSKAAVKIPGSALIVSESYFNDILIFEDGKTIVPNRFNDFKLICNYLEDCPVLVDKIKNGDYRRNALTIIVKEYNDCL